MRDESYVFSCRGTVPSTNRKKEKKMTHFNKKRQDLPLGCCWLRLIWYSERAGSSLEDREDSGRLSFVGVFKDFQ
jgi:hypothetical protein